MLQEASFKKWLKFQLSKHRFGGKKKKNQSKTVLMIRLMDRVHNSLPSYILKIEKYYGIWPESIVSVSLHHSYFRTNPSIQSPNLYLTSNMASLQHTFLKALIILMFPVLEPGWWLAVGGWLWVAPVTYYITWWLLTVSPTRQWISERALCINLFYGEMNTV